MVLNFQRNSASYSPEERGQVKRESETLKQVQSKRK